MSNQSTAAEPSDEDKELTPYEEEQRLFDVLLKKAISRHYEEQSRLPKEDREPFFMDRRGGRALKGGD